MNLIDYYIYSCDVMINTIGMYLSAIKVLCVWNFFLKNVSIEQTVCIVDNTENISE